MKKLFLTLFILLAFISTGQCAVVTDSYVTSDDVSIDRLESNRVALTNGINSGDGSLIQAGTIPASALDDNANPENRWDEGFNDFVFSGLIVPTSTDLDATTTSGIVYVNGTRVVKDATAKTYTASKWTWVDISDNGTYTYQETAILASEPPVSTNSIRISRVSTDTTKVLSTTDERVTEINIAAGSAGSLADTDADTLVQTEESTDEDILRFDLGDTTLAVAQEVVTIQAIDTTNIMLQPTTDSNFDLGSSSKEFRDLYIDGTATVDNFVFDVGFTDSTGTIVIASILDEDSMLSVTDTSLVTGESIKAYVDAGFEKVSVTTITATTNSGDITIVPDEKYKVVFSVINTAEQLATIGMRFNSDSAQKYGKLGEALDTSTSIEFEEIGTGSQGGVLIGEFVMDTIYTDQMVVGGFAMSINHAAIVSSNTLNGIWDNDVAVTDFEIFSEENITGEVLLYKYND